MQVNIKKAFERSLLAIPNGLPKSSTAFENVSFTPKADQTYQRCNVVPLPPENPTMGDGYHRLVGWFQVVVSTPFGKGTGDLDKYTSLIVDFYKRGTTLREGTDVIIVDKTPQVSPSYINKEDNRVEAIVRISYFSSQYS